MKSIALPLCLALLATSLFGLLPRSLSAGEALKLPLAFEEPAGVERKRWPVRFGVPLPKGRLPQGKEKDLRLSDESGAPVAAQARVAASWPDGSAKWVHLDSQVNLKAKQTAAFTLSDAGGGVAAPQAALKVTETADAIAVDTGVLSFSVLTKLPGGLGSLSVGGKAWPAPPLKDALVLDYQTEGPPLNTPAGRCNWKRDAKPGAETIRQTAAAGKDYLAKVESASPLRVVIRTEGWYGADGKEPACRYIVRYTAYAGRPEIYVQHTFIFTEDPAKCFIRRIGLRVPFGKAALIRTGGADEALEGSEVKPGAEESVALLSMGPEVMNHNNVLPEEGSRKDVAFSLFSHTGDGSDVATRKEVAKGRHVLGYMTAVGEGRGLTVSVRDFWRQHPNELAYSAADGALSCWLWTDHGNKVVDTRNPVPFGTRIRGETTLGGIATGFAKTHEILLRFHGAEPEQLKGAAEAAAAFDQPVWPHAAPEWNCATEAYPYLHPYDFKRFPGLERQIEILYAWININQKMLHWDGIFDHGGVLIEFDNHGQRYSGGRRGTWCDLDYAGWINEDGQQTHHLFMHYFRTGRRDYLRMGESMVRMVSDVSGIHHYNPKVPHSDSRVGGGHRHDMTPWHSLNTGYSIATLGAIDYYYFTGDDRMKDILLGYGKLCAANSIPAGYGGAHLTASLVRIWEATGVPEFKEKALPRLLNNDVRSGSLKPGFRTPTDLWPHLIFQEQILEHKETADLLLETANGKGPMMHEIKGWAYLRTKDPKYLEWCRGSLDWKHWKTNLPYCAKLTDPWAMDWKQLREAMNHMSDWYVKIYINSQQVGRFPMLMRALAEGEKVVIAPPQPPAPPAEPKKEGEAPAQPPAPPAEPKKEPETPAK